MKKYFKFIFIMALSLISISLFAETGLDIMKRVDARPKSKSSKQTTTMTLIDKRGKERVRSVVGYTKDFGDVKKSVMIFKKPADVKGVGFLSFSYDSMNKDDDSWLYMPALRKARRISGSKKNGSFMGTDFTYNDMGSRTIEEDTHTLLREEKLNGHDCWVIESKPKKKVNAYSKFISWIRKDILLAEKVEFYDKKGSLLKTLTNSNFEKIGDIWIVKKMEMHDVQKKHKTILEVSDVKLNCEIKDSYFSVASLERGRIR